MRRGLWGDVSCAKELCLSPSSPLTCHELSEGLRAGGRDGQRKLVDGYSVGYSKAVDTTVGHLPSQQLPQQHPKTVGKTKGRVPSSTYSMPFHPKAMRSQMI